MSAENKSYARLSFHNAFNVLLVLIGLFLLSVWAERKAADVEGPSRLVRGPQGTIYVQVDRSIAKVSTEGELLGLLDLGTDASVPDVSDFFVEQDGRLLFARSNSQLLQYYSPEGKMLGTFAGITPPQGGKNLSCYLTRDPSTGIVYFADTPRNTIRIFAPDQKEIRTIAVPSGTQPDSPLAARSEGSDLERIFSSETPLQHPHGLTFAGDRLIATDTGNSRIVLFFFEGALDKIIPVFPLESASFINPIRVDRYGDRIYVVVRGQDFADGRVQSFELHTGLPRDFRYPGTNDPWDVLARRDDVLVADRASLTVLRYGHSGRFLGTFGRPAVQNLYAVSRLKRKTFELIRVGSLAGMGFVLAWLLYPLTGKLTALGNILGREGGIRKKLLLLIPGMGQAAAGRLLRAGMLLLTLLLFAALFVYSWFQYQSPSGASMSLPELITTWFLAYTAWIAIVLDGIRLTRKPADNDDRSCVTDRQPFFAVVITVFAAVAVQLAREFIVFMTPDSPPAIQQVFHLLITSVHGHSSLSAASLPASILFGWGGAGAALFGTFAWQAKARGTELMTGIVTGFVAGMYSWVFSAVAAGSRSEWMLYAPVVQGMVLGLFTWLYFRRKGMPVLIMPAAVAGAWIGNFLKFFLSDLVAPITKLLSVAAAGGLWTGATARLELILIPAAFIHLAIGIAWNITQDTSPVSVEAVARRKEAGILASSHSR
jgi:hypothetical protein